MKAADPGAGPAVPAEAPWLMPEVLDRVLAILAGHHRAFGVGLLPELGQRSPRQWAQELFVAPLVLLAHDGSADPRLIYANRAALLLWRRRWSEMVGLPSRLTAEPSQRPSRALALQQAQRQGGVRGYAGIRIDSHGRRFRLEGARLWSLAPQDAAAADASARDASVPAQAAAFCRWWWL
ncbi:MAG: MEKHLA domain-containing protein [Cyanobium sp.]